MERHVLSKSTFIRGVQCLKSLYLYKKRNFLRDPLSAEQQAVFSRGTNVGILARQLFPGGKDVSPPSPSLYSRSVALTSDYIAKGVEVIYEAAFQFEKVLVAIDILVLTPDGWIGIEVKSSRAISETYILDAALQYYVITGSGLKLADMRIMHINPDYVREGELIPGNFFKSQSVLEQVLEKQESISQQIRREKEAIELPHSPEIPIGLHCHKPYTCDFIGHCWKNYKRPIIFELDAFLPEHQQSLFDRGYHSVNELADAPGLNTDQKMQVSSHISGEMFLDRKALSQFLQNTEGSCAFLKVLYCKPAVPLFDGTRPYQHLPFAFALLSADKGASPEYFIVPPGQYLIGEFYDHLKAKLSGLSRIILIGQSSELQTEIEKMNLNLKVLDLLEPFEKRMLYLPDFVKGINVFHLTDVHIIENSGPGNIESDTMAGVRYLALTHALEGETYSLELESIEQFALQKVRETDALYSWLKEKANT
jgi:hypothetical protein